MSVSLDTAACLINLGNVYNRLGEHSSALEQYRRAIDIQERLPYSGPDRAAAYQNIGAPAPPPSSPAAAAARGADPAARPTDQPAQTDGALTDGLTGADGLLAGRIGA